MALCLTCLFFLRYESKNCSIKTEKKSFILILKGYTFFVLQVPILKRKTVTNELNLNEEGAGGGRGNGPTFLKNVYKADYKVCFCRGWQRCAELLTTKILTK